MWSFIDAKLRWNDKQLENELWIDYWDEKTKLQGELTIKWYDLHDGNALAGKLEVFEDAWLVLYHY